MKTCKYLFLVTTVCLLGFAGTVKTNAQVVEGVVTGINILGDVLGLASDAEDIILLRKLYNLSKQVDSLKTKYDWMAKIAVLREVERAINSMICNSIDFHQYSRFINFSVCGNGVGYQLTMVNTQKASDLLMIVLEHGKTLNSAEMQQALADALSAIEGSNEQMNEMNEAIRQAQYERMSQQHRINQRARGYGANINAGLLHRASQ